MQNLYSSYFNPISLGPYAEPLKRWAECVSRDELQIKSLEEYSDMKNICDRVMVLRYSDLVRGLEDEDKKSFSLMKEQKLQLFADQGEDIDATEFDVEARILPQKLFWPSFFVSKQKYARSKNVLLRRIQPPVQNLENNAVQYLCDVSNPLNVLWTGAAGIGKSAYGNVVAELLVKKLFIGESIDVIAWRIDDYVYLISPNSKRTGFRMDSYACNNLGDLRKIITHEFHHRRGVVIVELEEKEVLPSFEYPILCSSSIKDVTKVFKEQLKQPYVSYCMNCYELWEIQAAANIMYGLGDRVLHDCHKKYVATALNRFTKVGGLPRYVFANEEFYSARVCAMEEAAIDAQFLQHLDSSSFDKLTGQVKFFFVPQHTHLRSWNRVCPAGSIKLSFLSPYCEQMILKIVSGLGVEKIRTSLLWYPKWMLEESLMHASLSAESIIQNSELSIRNAEWYIDPGRNKNLLQSHKKADPEFVSEIPLYASKEYVQEAISFGSINMDYKENILYTAVPNVNMVVADCFMVDHRKKRVYLYQTSVSPGKNHGFKEHNVRKYVNEMHLAENNYKLCLVYVRGAHHGDDTGLSFISYSDTVCDLPEDLRSRVQIYIVRANYFKDRYLKLPGISNVEKLFERILRDEQPHDSDDNVIMTRSICRLIL